jgi:arylsulfatase A-like enzyme
MLILLITLDCVRADRIGGALTPNLNALDREWTTFSQAFAQCQHTLPSHLSMLTSNYLWQHGVYSNLQKKDLPAHALPRRLAERGYDIQAFVSTDFLAIQMSNQIGEKDNRFPDPQSRELSARYHRLLRRWLGPRRSASATLAKGRLWLQHARRNRNAFLWLHLFDAHMVYTAPKGYLRKFVAPGTSDISVREALQRRGWWAPTFEEYKQRLPLDHFPQRYGAAIAYQDAMLGRFFAWLKARGWWDDALIFLTADHGECLMGDHNIYCAHKKLFDETIHVPLKVKFPKGRLAGNRCDALVQHVDIAPTAAALVGFEEPLYMGKDLAGVAEGRVSPYRAVFAEHEENIMRAVRNERYLWVERTPGAVDRWDLPKDDGSLFLREGVAVAFNSTTEIARLKGQLEDYLTRGKEAQSAWGSIEGEQGAIAESLKGLGYM